ncbi:MAG: ComF family protein [Xanthomonadales bacterium]|jgi:ComF family protein|nr:ComF family protein [Xanthomonadales bacterium]
MPIPLFTRLAAWLVPPHCALCDAAGAQGLDLCGDCLAALPRSGAACGHCGLPTAIPVARCGRCLAAPPRFDAVIAPLRYAYPADRAIQAYKFYADLSLGRSLSALLVEAVRAQRAPLPAVLLPVPLHRSRLRERGFNQSLEIARRVGTALGVPVDPSRLRRTRATAAQSGLDRRARRQNVRGAFTLEAGAALPDRVAIIDDVLTTGATVSELARLLKDAGVAHVAVWTLARAGD